MNKMPYHARRELALILWGGFFRCPTTGRILERLKGDDKILCNCRTSNPEVPQERTEETGVHIVRFLRPATVDEYLIERGRCPECDGEIYRTRMGRIEEGVETDVEVVACTQCEHIEEI